MNIKTEGIETIIVAAQQALRAIIDKQAAFADQIDDLQLLIEQIENYPRLVDWKRQKAREIYNAIGELKVKQASFAFLEYDLDDLRYGKKQP